MEKNENFKSELETQYTILIQAQERSEKRQFIALLVILVLTLVSVVVSTVFAFMAYRGSTKAHEDISETEKIYYQTLVVVYINGPKMELNNIVTGYRLNTPKVIKVSNEGNTEATFNIKIASIKTSFISSNNLFYTIDSNGENSSTKQLPLSDKVIMDNIKLGPNETKTYTINVVFQGTIPLEETNNYYHASIIIEQTDNKSSLLEQ